MRNLDTDPHLLIKLDPDPQRTRISGSALNPLLPLTLVNNKAQCSLRASATLNFIRLVPVAYT